MRSSKGRGHDGQAAVVVDEVGNRAVRAPDDVDATEVSGELFEDGVAANDDPFAHPVAGSSVGVVVGDELVSDAVFV